MKKIKIFGLLSIFAMSLILFSCGDSEGKKDDENKKDTTEVKINTLQKKVESFATFTLKTDLSHLSDNQKEMLKIFFQIADIADALFKKQAYGDLAKLIETTEDQWAKEFIKLNYGPWERLNGNKSFIEGIGTKPKGAGFYPVDMTKEEFEMYKDKNKASLYTVIQRGEDRKLKTVWYHEAYADEIKQISDLLNKAAELADDKGFKKYLELRAKAVLDDDYFKSDMAWMDMKDNLIDFVVGPIENYEDALFGYKTAYEAYILIKDVEWSNKLAKYAGMLPEMQKSLPVADEYKKEKPGTNSDLGAYDVIYYAGDCNAGSKTIAINLPNDDKVQLKKGSRRLQLKNAMQAKFDKILVPISNILIDESQRQYIQFEAFFANTMFHETAHGLGIKNLIKGKGSVSDALKEFSTTIEEGKADILGLYFVTKLYENGEFTEEQMKNSYVTFMASIFRSIRFGVSSSHGKANMLRFYYFKDKGAFVKDEKTGTYKVDFEKMKEAMTSLTEKILVLQGDGNYDAAKQWIDEKANISDELQKDLDRVNEAGIPVDIRFEQGPSVVGL